MEIILNGKPYKMKQKPIIEGLLKELDLWGQKIAVERNLEIVPRSNWATQELCAGDRIEIIHFVGGGR